jgi:hypothetical protein
VMNLEALRESEEWDLGGDGLLRVRPCKLAGLQTFEFRVTA